MYMTSCVQLLVFLCSIGGVDSSCQASYMKHACTQWSAVLGCHTVCVHLLPCRSHIWLLHLSTCMSALPHCCTLPCRAACCRRCGVASCAASPSCCPKPTPYTRRSMRAVGSPRKASSKRRTTACCSSIRCWQSIWLLSSRRPRPSARRCASWTTLLVSGQFAWEIIHSGSSHRFTALLWVGLMRWC